MERELSEEEKSPEQLKERSLQELADKGLIGHNQEEDGEASERKEK